MNSYYEKFTATGVVKCIDEEIPFEVPQGWEWCRLGEISTYAQTKKKINAANAAPHIWGLDLEDIEKGGQLLRRKTVGERKAIGDKTIFNQGDILYSKLRPYLLKVLVAPESGICTPEIIPFTCYCDVCKDYVVSYLKSPYVDDYINTVTYGVKMPRVGTDTMISLLVPLPPISEQIRIVAKVMELMKHIEKYGNLQDSLDNLNKELPNNFRKSILQEAIQGKLVPQIAEESTAQDLLESIKEEKQQLVKEGKLKKSALNDSVIFRGDDNKYWEKIGNEIVCIDDEIPFEIPSSWSWVRVSTILNVSSARRVHQKDWRKQGIPFYRAREIGKLAEYGCVENELFIDHTLFTEFAKSGVPNEGDLMVTAVGTLGKVYVVKKGDSFYYKDGSVLCFANDYKLNPNFLKYVIESPMFISQFLGESQGTTVATLTMVRVNNYLIPLPPLKEQQRIVEQYDKITSIMRR